MTSQQWQHLITLLSGLQDPALPSGFFSPCCRFFLCISKLQALCSDASCTIPLWYLAGTSYPTDSKLNPSYISLKPVTHWPFTLLIFPTHKETKSGQNPTYHQYSNPSTLSPGCPSFTETIVFTTLSLLLVFSPRWFSTKFRVMLLKATSSCWFST